MAEDLNLASTFSGLSLSESASPSPQPERSEATQALIPVAQAHAEQVPFGQTEIANASNTPGHEEVTQPISLREALQNLVTSLEKFNAAVKQCAVNQWLAIITSLAGQETQTKKLLSHFDGKLRKIIKHAMHNTINEETAMREILERCYSQVVDPHGTLNCDDYYLALEEACLGWPYDLDFETEAYYEHEDRLGADERYAARFRVETERYFERQMQNQKNREERWISFWVQALANCLGGPTLFNPRKSVPGSLDVSCSWERLTNTPRYLFRAFDESSSGHSDEHVVASEESLHVDDGHHSRVDIFSRPRVEARKMLHDHLHRPGSNFGHGQAGDNLMSWSSSLLFVIQYAIWRCHHGRRAPEKVRICAVDTTKFPRGQFARDLELIRVYREAPKFPPPDNDGNDPFLYHFDFRLCSRQWDNGEFLSQGEVYHGGRSCVFSLGQLKDVGFYDLYPEMAEEDSKQLWQKRVGTLRGRWSHYDHPTTRQDMETALGIASACFQGFNPADVALLFLTFKERKIKGKAKTRLSSRSPDLSEKRQEYLAGYGPKEVQRYIDLVEILTGEKCRDCCRSLSVDIIREAFEMT